MKQGTEKTEFIKEATSDNEKFIFQKNNKTKIGFTILVVFLVAMVIGVVISKYFFTS